MVWNNLTFMDNATDLGTVVNGVNDMTGGWLIGGIMLTFFMVSLFVFYGRVGVGSILVGNGFVLSIAAIIFANMGALPLWVLGVTLSILIIGLLTLFMSE